LLLYSLRFDVPHRFTSRKWKLRWSLTSCFLRLFLTEREREREREILSLTADRKRLPVLSRIRAGGTRFSDVYTDIGERSLLFAAGTYFFGIRDVREKE
jgi:hypothetical protein